MAILEELLKEIKSSNIDEQVKILCDKIFEEEKLNIHYYNILPTGPNVFLALEVPGRRSTEVAFVSLERESSNKFIIVVWTTTKQIYQDATAKEESIFLKKQRVVEIDEFKPEKILQEYAKFIKYMKGE